MTAGLKLLHSFASPGATLVRPQVMETQQFSKTVRTYETERGTHVLEGLRVFKHGSFKDSMGIERTWEPLHLDQMALHYQLLKEGGILPNVPVRADHSISVQDVVGYINAVYRDTEDDLFLAADIEFTEPDAFEKWERGTWRSRSLEVGMYESNEGATYWPVIVGLAFVDLPAVEGLHAKKTSTFSHVLEDKENQVDPAQWAVAAMYAQAIQDWEKAANYAKAIEDWSKAANYAAALEAHQRQASELGVAPQTANHGHVQTHAFSIGGRMSTDPAEVQRHISALEEFQSNTTQLNRNEFVDGLAKNNAILATQVDVFKNMVKGMTPDQFAEFQKAYEGQGSPSLLTVHGNQHGGNHPGSTPAEEAAVLQETVDQMRRSGFTQERLEKTEAYRKLQSLKGQA